MRTNSFVGLLLSTSLGIAAAPAFADAGDTLVYVSLAQPCRLLDTRSPGPGPLTAAHGTYLFGSSNTDIASASQHGNSSGCGIPTGVEAINVNFNMFDTTASGNVLTWSSDGAKPAAGTAVYNPSSSQVVYNGASATLSVGSIDGRFNLSVANGQMDMTINVLGYWRVLAEGPTYANQGAFAWGFFNQAGYNSVAGGANNQATGSVSASIGEFDISSGSASMALGYSNTASGTRSVALGDSNSATATDAVAIGNSNSADGLASVALGQNAFSNGHANVMVFGDGSAATKSSADYQFMARAKGGFVLYSGTGTTGVLLSPGAGAWTSLSDRNAKTAVEQIDGRDVLDRVVAMPLATWQYKTQDAKYRHMGPMAQDFYAAFGLGESDTGIDTIDADGVALAAIQGLNAKLEAKLEDRDREVAELRAQVAELAAAINRRNYSAGH